MNSDFVEMKTSFPENYEISLFLYGSTTQFLHWYLQNVYDTQVLNIPFI